MDDEKILGIEGGGTKTAWALVANGAIIESGKLPPSNLRLTPLDQITKIFHVLPREVDRIGVFLAGCVTEEDRAILLKLARAVWPRAKIVAGSDRDSGMAACLRDRDGIAVNAGTGSSVTGRSGWQIEKAGGWGHILGDAGGAYFVSIRALRSVLREYDLRRGEREFAANILRALGLNNFDELVRWAQTADKMEIASLAPVVFEAARKSDEAARQIIAAGVSALVDFTTAVSMRLQLETPEVRLMGGLFENQKFYGVAFAKALSEKIPGAEVALCESPPEVGAAWLAADERLQMAKAEEPAAAVQLISSTEEANPKSANLDRLSAREIVELFVAEEKSVEEGLRQCVDQLARAIELSASAIGSGGRIFYVGAGTSGRLGVLDAAEIPPTFGASADLFQGIIAGGAPALRQSIEGAEDDARSGALAMDERRVKREDLVIGISASGRAAFVMGALRRAQEIGAQTILLTCNVPKRQAWPADISSRHELPLRKFGPCDQSQDQSRNRCRLHAPESRDGDKSRAEYHQHRRNGSAGAGAWKFDDRSSTDEQKTARASDRPCLAVGGVRSRECAIAARARGLESARALGRVMSSGVTGSK